MKNTKTREERVEELLYVIGGLEAAILEAMDQKDWEFIDMLKVKKMDFYERLRRLSYGLPEERSIPTEK